MASSENRRRLIGARNADSPTQNKDGKLLFVKPWEEQQPFDKLIDFIREQELSGITLESVQEVKYAQTREPFIPRDNIF